MFGWLFSKKRVDVLEEETKKSFSAVKKDFESVSSWLKHLNEKNEELFLAFNEVRREIATIQDDVEGLREGLSFANLAEEGKQLSKKTGVLNRQTAVQGVQEGVQTAVQTGNLHQILQNLSSNERMIIFALINSDLKLSYEDVARLLGKERSTIRGQINGIKQKSEGLIEEIVESNGKKRVYVRDEIKEKLAKYAKVRAKEGKKYKKLPKTA